MEIITLEEFKAHARIMHDDEDADIQGKVDAANEYVSGLLDVAEDEVPDYEPPADVKQAVLLVAGHWLENREETFPGSINDIPLDAQEILLNHRGWAF